MENYKTKKKYGQCFLNSQEILSKIIEVSNVKKTDNILEIGPGLGILTKELLREAKKVTCIEIDKDLEKRLLEKFSDIDNFELIMSDILQFNFKRFEKCQEKLKVVANIPYYITSPIIQKLVTHRDKISEIYLMVQKEVGERLVAKPGSSKRGILTLTVEYFADVEYLFTINKSCFSPAPKVDSAFIKIKFKTLEYKNPNIMFERLLQIAKIGFTFKRKKFINNINSKLDISKLEATTILEELDIDPKVRAEDLSIEQFLNIYNKIYH